MYTSSMQIKNKNLLYYSLASFLFGTALCIIIKPHGLTANDGLSYYGVFKSTIIPYAISLLLPSFFFLRIGLELDSKKYMQLRLVFFFFSICMLGLVLTPYNANTFLYALHTTLGSILFATQLLVTGVMAIEQKDHLLIPYYWLIELIAGIVSALYLAPTKGYLLEYQVIFQLFFSLILISYFTKKREP